MESNNKKLEIARLFTDINHSIKRGMRKSFEEVGITMPQGLVIATLITHGEMKISELGNKINLSNSTISGIVDRLEKQGLVARMRSSEDRRIVYVKVTPKFKEMHKGFHQKAEASFEGLLSQGTPEELEQILEGMQALKRILLRKTQTEKGSSGC